MKDIDLSEIDFNNMGAWPMPGKIAFVVIICLIVLAIGYFVDLSTQFNRLSMAEKQEQQLKQDYKSKYGKVINLETYKVQMKEMEDSFGAMLRQLPSKTEVEDLLVDISQTGLSSGVEFKLFKPGAETFVDFYAELPIKMSMTGTYHQFGTFVSGVASLPRIVTLHDINIKSDDKSGSLTMELTAKTYRYLDSAELAAQRAEDRKKKQGNRR